VGLAQNFKSSIDAVHDGGKNALRYFCARFAALAGPNYILLQLGINLCLELPDPIFCKTSNLS
jgi:hypothetical protein